MAKRTYVVMGATGNIGRVLTENLLKQGHQVKALGRDQKKLSALKAKRAETVLIESFDQLAVLNNASKGADAFFSFIPPANTVDNFEAYQDKVGESIIAAIQKNNIPYVLNLSSLSAHLSEKTGPIKGLYRQEQRLNSLKGVNVLHLRPSYFMENLFWSIPVIKQYGVLATAFKENLSIPMVATLDIGIKAAEFLDRLDFKGSLAFEFVGPRAVTLSETAKLIGSVIGQPNLKYIQAPYAEVEKGMIASGVSPNFAKIMVELYKALNDGLCEPTQKITPDHQGKTTLEHFLKIFANVFSEKEMVSSN